MPLIHIVALCPWGRLFWQMARLMVLAGLCAFVSSFIWPFVPLPVLPRGIDYVATVAQAAPGTVWVDARSAEEFLAGHLPGAIHLSMDNWREGFPLLAQAWQPGMAIGVYCSHHCRGSLEVAQRLKQALPGAKLQVLQEGYQP